MVTQSDLISPVLQGSDTAELSRLYQEGIVAGVIGAATIAIWFLILDTINGQPLYTPTVLGTALFRRGESLASPESLPVSFEMVLMYTWIHGLIFAFLGGLASRLLRLAERNPNLGFGILLLFVVFEFGFLVVATLFEERILRALSWQAILVGNLLAAAAMAGYFWRRHPHLEIRP
ncbi:MAG: hypothetical protein HY574_08525 [candidate division NC10 bacterium]|nr:hypothetical protein [candidate division NC10 bacterium]